MEMENGGTFCRIWGGNGIRKLSFPVVARYKAEIISIFFFQERFQGFVIIVICVICVISVTVAKLNFFF